MELGQDFIRFSTYLEQQLELTSLARAIKWNSKLTGKSRYWSVTSNLGLFGVVDDPVCNSYKRMRTKMFL